MGLTCRDVMVPPHIQKTIHPDESVSAAFQLIKESRARFIPAVDENGIYVGLFSAPTLLKLVLPQAALMEFSSDTGRLNIANLSFFSLDKDDFEQRIDQLKDEKVRDNLSLPENIPVTGPDTPVMEGIFLIHKFKRHLVVVEADTQKFVGTVSANSILDNALS